MTKQNKTKNALILSTLSLVLCFAMLVGSTFAWFTDSATTGVNVIQAGTLDVVFEMYDDATDEWIDAEGKTLSFKKADGGTEVLFEPGAQFELPELRIRNAGNLSFKFKLLVNGVDGDSELASILDVYLNKAVKIGTLEELMKDPDGAAYGVLAPSGKTVTSNGITEDDISAEYAISLKMPETIGNELQGKKIEGMSFTVVAAQLADENDSYGNQYDAAATYPVISVEEAEAVMAAAAPGSIIIIDEQVSGSLTVPATANGITVAFEGDNVKKITLADGAKDITIDGAGISAESAGDRLIQLSGDHGNVTLKNLNLSGVANVKNGHAVSGGNGTALTLDGCMISNIGYGVQDTFSGYESLVITNSTFENTVSWAILNQGATSSVTIDNCTFLNCQAGILKATGLQANGALVFTNNTMTGCKEHNPYGLIQLGNQDTCTITWSGNTFDGAEMVNPFN